MPAVRPQQGQLAGRLLVALRRAVLGTPTRLWRAVSSHVLARLADVDRAALATPRWGWLSQVAVRLTQHYPLHVFWDIVGRPEGQAAQNDGRRGIVAQGCLGSRRGP